jgi:hypothetical protein
MLEEDEILENYSDTNRFYQTIYYIYYSKSENMFYDPCGILIENIFEIITPNDLFLFRKNPRKNKFPMRDEPYILCEIITDLF